MLKRLVIILLIFGSFIGFAEQPLEITQQARFDVECEFELRQGGVPLQTLKVGDIITRNNAILKYGPSMQIKTLYLVVDRYVTVDQQIVLTLMGVESQWFRNPPFLVEEVFEHRRVYIRAYENLLAKTPLSVKLSGQAVIEKKGNYETYVTHAILKNEQLRLRRGREDFEHFRRSNQIRYGKP